MASKSKPANRIVLAIHGGADALRALIAGKKTLPADMMQRAIAPVQELQDTEYYKTADELYRALPPLAEARERCDILFGLGRIAASPKYVRLVCCPINFLKL